MPAGWAIKANFPNLNSGRVFRFDWFTCFLQFLTAMFVTTALLSKLIPQVRLCVVLSMVDEELWSACHICTTHQLCRTLGSCEHASCTWGFHQSTEGFLVQGVQHACKGCICSQH